MTPKTKMHTQRLTTFLSDEQLDKIKVIADKKGLTVSALIRLYVLEGIEREEK